MNFVMFINCTVGCLGKIPWWVWIVLPLAGAVLGALGYLFSVLSAGTSIIVASALVTAMIIGALGAVGLTFLTCLLGCLPILTK